MKRIFVTTALLLTTLSISQQVKAQTSVLRFGVGVDAGATLKDPSRFVLGADGRLQIPLGNSFSGILTTGYYQFFGRDLVNTAAIGFGIIPLKAGIKYFPVKNVYIAGEAGAGFGTKKGLGTSFVYSPSVGLAFVTGLDISLKYEDYTKYDGYASQLALRIAYGFKL